jgi:hypothetical protein
MFGMRSDSTVPEHKYALGAQELKNLLVFGHFVIVCDTGT